MRVLIHPGFHKTGTSSLQRGARQLADQLAPHLRALTTADLADTVRIARRYSARPTDRKMVQFRAAFARTLSGAALQDGQVLLISSADFSGYIPSNNGVTAYDAAPLLVAAAVSEVEDHFGPGTDITVFFTTRGATAWKRSVYFQNLRAQRLTEDFDSYHPSLNRAAQLDDIVEATAARLGPRARVISVAIEDCGATPLGPLGVALDLLGVPTRGLPALPAMDVQPPDAADKLLALNRSDVSDKQLKEAKRQLLRRYRKSGQTHRD